MEESVVNAPGSVKRLSASVVINETAVPLGVHDIQTVVGPLLVTIKTEGIKSM
ncbi:MAG: hypothetical protein RQM92_02560 [Candidatus Syntrophopropionicum ammoniitolerans]